MEKLIELLNEYAHTYADHYDDTGEEIVIDFFKHTDQCFLYTEDGQFESLVDDVIISKRYGFIKWLVENNKINFKKFDGDNYDYLENPIGSNNYDTVWDYKTIIQWLSISDTPIEDLISYLR